MQIGGRTLRLKVEDLTDDFLKEGWLPDTVEHGIIESFVESDTPKSGKTWIAIQVGFIYSILYTVD